MYVCMYVCMYLCMYVCIYTKLCTYIYNMFMYTCNTIIHINDMRQTIGTDYTQAQLHTRYAKDNRRWALNEGVCVTDHDATRELDECASLVCAVCL